MCVMLCSNQATQMQARHPRPQSLKIADNKLLSALRSVRTETRHEPVNLHSTQPSTSRTFTLRQHALMKNQRMERTAAFARVESELSRELSALQRCGISLVHNACNHGTMSVLPKLNTSAGTLARLCCDGTGMPCHLHMPAACMSIGCTVCPQTRVHSQPMHHARILPCLPGTPAAVSLPCSTAHTHICRAAAYFAAHTHTHKTV